MTSLTASSPSLVTIASSGIHRVDTTHDVRLSNASVTVKSVAPVKKMTSVIDTKTGHVTSSLVSQETGRRSNSSSVLMTSSPTAITSPSSLLTYGPESPSGDLNHNWMTSSSSPRATSLLMTSTSMQVYSVTSEGTANTLTDHRIPASRNSSSVILRSIPDTHPAEMTSSGHVMTTTVTQAEVHPHPQPETRRSTSLLTDSTSIKRNYSAGLTNELPDESEIDCDSVKDESVDQEQVFSDVVVETQPSIVVEGKDTDFGDSAKVALSVPDVKEKAITPSVARLSTSQSGISKVPDSTPEEFRIDSGSSDGGLDVESETRQPSTFRFIGWNGNESTIGGTVDPQCHRVLIFKDSEIVLMLKVSLYFASCKKE